MRFLILLPCFIFTFLTFLSSVSYGFSFDFDIDKFTVKSGSSTFVDDFDDGLEPPSGPSGPTTYVSNFPISSNRESGGVLNLNSDDGNTFPGDDVHEVVVGLRDSTAYFVSGVGGSVEGKFSFANGFPVDTGFGIGITSLSSNNSPFEEVIFQIDKDVSGDIIAWFGSDDSIIGSADISESDVTNSLLGLTDITLRMDIDITNMVTASLDFGSDGFFDLTVSGSYALSFFPEINYSSNFFAEEPFPDPVPEPTTIALLGIGLAGLVGVGARRKWKKKAVDSS